MAAHPPRASPPEEFAEFAKYAQLLPLREGTGAANTLQDYFDGTEEPTQPCGSSLILGEGQGNATEARFARVRTHHRATPPRAAAGEGTTSISDADRTAHRSKHP